MKKLIWARITRINTDRARSMDDAQRVSNGKLSLANTVLLHDIQPICLFAVVLFRFIRSYLRQSA